MRLTIASARSETGGVTHCEEIRELEIPSVGRALVRVWVSARIAYVDFSNRIWLQLCISGLWCGEQ